MVNEVPAKWSVNLKLLPETATMFPVEEFVEPVEKVNELDERVPVYILLNPIEAANALLQNNIDKIRIETFFIVFIRFFLTLFILIINTNNQIEHGLQRVIHNYHY